MQPTLAHGRSSESSAGCVLARTASLGFVAVTVLHLGQQARLAADRAIASSTISTQSPDSRPRSVVPAEGVQLDHAIVGEPVGWGRSPSRCRATT